ncbi:alpha/beta fold hydrolase [uncultured Caulobacter sp.]|uniref:alpha/beta hydrolase family protein n=1 Tax=uncultured Caulobacter sp. TaxID=158749 RepID=UPI00262A4881|nr:alpha/beta fold hydrolase [uncultured Caulobacter sp.]
MRFLTPAAIAAALLAPSLAQAQTGAFAGDWYGALNAGGGQVPLVIHVAADGGASVDSPAQHAVGLAAAATVADGKLSVTLKAVPAGFQGALSADGKTLVGEWIQGGVRLPLTLSHTAPAAAPAPKRPQTPQPPFPYRAEEVAYVNPASGLRLAGTLTLPPGAGPFPAVVLITGSGQQDRDETFFDHKPFWVIADALTRRGVAVLRVDDRGVGGSQAGDLARATTSQFATDVAAGVAFLRARGDIDPDRIGLIGHSEGGQIAPMVAAKDPRVAFLVLMAGPAIDGLELLVAQNRAIAEASGASAGEVAAMLKTKRAWFEAARDARDDDDARTRLSAVLDQQGVPAGAPQRAAVLALAVPWWREFLKSHPAEVLKTVQVPVLALNGAKDTQVPAAANLAATRQALSGHKDVEIVALPGLNHLFQTAGTGLPDEYGKIEQTLAPEALTRIVDWTVAHAAKRAAR